MSNLEANNSPIFIHGGKVLPCDGVSSVQEAIVVENGRISGVGTYDEMRSIAPANARKINVDGATVLPGLVDTHPHAMHFSTISMAMVDLSDAVDHEDIVTRIRERAAVTPKGQWIMCTPVGEAHYFIRRSYRDLKEGRLPERKVLDHASSEHPIMIQAWAPRIPNVCAMNSMALDMLGIAWHTPKRVCDVWIDRDNNNELTGILRGSVTNYYTHDPFWMQIWDKLPLPPEEIWEHGGRAGMAAMNALGVTTIYESHAMEPEHIYAYDKLLEQDSMNCRVKTSLESADMAFHPHYRPTPDEMQQRLELALSMRNLDSDLLRHDGITVARSGPCGPGFINLYEPFKSPYGELIYGYEFLPKWVEEQCVDFCMDHGLSMNILAATSKDHDDFFDSIKKHNKEEIRKRKWLLQHALLVNEQDAERYADYNMDVTTCKGFHWGKGDMWGERIGKHTWKDLIPLRRWLEHGVTVGCGTDWGPRNIFEQIKIAETCEFAESGYQNLDAGQAITREEALLMWTRDAAKVLAWDDVGTIATGKHADITIVDRDPLTCELEELPATKVLHTMLSGNPVFDSGELATNT